MTSEEIKQNTTMRDVLSKYGIQTNRSGMCSCPFHKDRKPSMKVFKDGFKCFSCNRGGDVFKFVQLMENCSFKDSYFRLGGTYENMNDRQKTLASMKRATIKRTSKKTIEEDFYSQMAYTFKRICNVIDTEQPLSDKWCMAQNMLPLIQQIWECKFINNEEVNEIDGIRLYRKVRCEFDSK